jgi:hypothetical protein
MTIDWLGMLKTGLGTLAALLVVLGLIVMFVRDVTQKQHTVLRNFPVVGRFRYWFEELGEYFRSTSSRTTARRCRSTARRARGSTGSRRTRRPHRLRLDLRPARAGRAHLRQRAVPGARIRAPADAAAFDRRGLLPHAVRRDLARSTSAG